MRDSPEAVDGGGVSAAAASARSLLAKFGLLDAFDSEDEGGIPVPAASQRGSQPLMLEDAAGGGASDSSSDEDEDDSMLPAQLSSSAAAVARAGTSLGTIAEEDEDEEIPPVTQWRATGEGLSSAFVGSEANTFLIEGLDASGVRRPAGEDALQHLKVELVGTAMVRVRIVDGGDGSFTCEYRVHQTGKYRLLVTHAGKHLAGSPFTVVARSAPGGLSDWREKKAREVANLKAARKEREAARKAPPKRREPSPRISPSEQLAKAYALALASIGSERRRRKSKSHQATHSHSAPPAAAPTGTNSSSTPMSTRARRLAQHEQPTLHLV
jgi:hypothetical protein